MTGKDEYITPPFTQKECKQWAKNHLINPRQNKETKTNDGIRVGSPKYIELLYTTLQYGMPTPRILDTIPDDKIEKISYRNANKLIENIEATNNLNKFLNNRKNNMSKVPANRKNNVNLAVARARARLVPGNE
jgi:hypothetical protein